MPAINTVTKHPSESETFEMDFGLKLHGRTISSVSSVSAETGLTVGSGSIVSSAHDSDGTDTIPAYEIGANESVQFTVSGGEDGRDYWVTVVVVASDGSTLADDGLVRVRSKGPGAG